MSTTVSKSTVGQARPFKAVFSDYVQISKPRIMVLLLVVAWAAMFVGANGGAGGLPPLGAFLAVTLAGICSTAASGAFNNVVERDRDGRMGRTAQRPVASGRIGTGAATVYGLVMTILAVAPLAYLGLWAAAGLVLAAIGYYVIVYTIALKPTTTQNIVIGGFAGSFPALIGWAGLGLSLAAWPPWLLAGLVFLWTPAHFWALALLYKDDYAAADYPMYPNVHGDKKTRAWIVVYSVLTAALSLALVWPLADAGWIYLAAAGFLGFVLVRRAVALGAEPSPKKYRTFFLFTIQYLGLLLLALMADRVLPFDVLA